jgi:hypothetical protein
MTLKLDDLTVEIEAHIKNAEWVVFLKRNQISFYPGDALDLPEGKGNYMKEAIKDFKNKMNDFMSVSIKE